MVGCRAGSWIWPRAGSASRTAGCGSAPRGPASARRWRTSCCAPGVRHHRVGGHRRRGRPVHRGSLVAPQDAFFAANSPARTAIVPCLAAMVGPLSPGRPRPGRRRRHGAPPALMPLRL